MKRIGPVLAAALVLGTCSAAEAQVIGTFSWQTQPFCNIVQLTIIQHGGVYQLLGNDDRCGLGAQPVHGTAVPAGAGVSMAFTIGAMNFEASISPANLSGTWADQGGNAGTFQFGGALTGPRRPAPSLAATPVTGGNGEGVGNTICVGGGIEVFTKNAFGQLVDARFSFVVPGYAHGQINSTGTIRTGSTNLIAVQRPSVGSYCLQFSNPQPAQAAAEATVVSIHSGR